MTIHETSVRRQRPDARLVAEHGSRPEYRFQVRVEDGLLATGPTPAAAWEVASSALWYGFKPY